MDQSLNRPDDLGKDIDTVFVDIDYEIIDHFSSHLYQSPNKAIEELIVNSFDAFATQVRVFIPGEQISARVLVWDNGESMSVEDLRQLWWIARSPKEGIADRVATSAISPGSLAPRKLIGKFGIGKLASYAVGHRLTHLCRRGGDFLRVTVDYRGVPRLDEIDHAGEPLRYPAPVVRLTEPEARQYVDSLLNGHANELLPQAWTEDSWTLAVIDELKTEVTLKPGRLRWVLGLGMPLRSDFGVWVNDSAVQSALESRAITTWDLDEPKLVARVEAEWAAALKNGEVTGALVMPVPGDSKTVRFPSLGDVTATVRLFDQSLAKGAASDMGRTFGFFVYVRGRLINPDDDKLLLHEPSFGTFYRSQFVLHIDSLDEILLADRERLDRSSPMIPELRVLQRAVYLAARDELTQRDDDILQQRSTENVLPIELRDIYREPLISLLLRRGFGPRIDPSEPVVSPKAMGVDERLATLDDQGFVVNYSHPLLEAIQQAMPKTQRNREAYRVVELFAVADELLEGYLYDAGVPEATVDSVMAWRDGLLRAMAAKMSGAGETIIHEVRETSYAGKRDFETALGKLFRLMGFTAEHRGASSAEDVLVVGPIGPGHFSFIVDAKSSVNAVPNDDADIAQAARHRDQVRAEWGVVVAREFAGLDSLGASAAIYKDCQSVGGLSLITVDVLEQLYRAVRTYYYPLDLVKEVLWSLSTPDDLVARISTLQHPVDGFDFRGVLEEIWRAQSEEASHFEVPIDSVMFKRDEWKQLGSEAFRNRLLGMETLSRGLIRVRGDSHVKMLQAPNLVAEQIQMSVGALEGPPET
jgi:hypothetical protein